jgi:hypothetical protein
MSPTHEPGGHDEILRRAHDAFGVQWEAPRVLSAKEQKRLKFLRDNAGPLFQGIHTMPDEELLKLDDLLSSFDQTKEGSVAATLAEANEMLDEIETEVQVYCLPDDGIEAHTMGEYVAVCWRLKQVKTQRSITYERSGEPYIDFIDVREHNGEYYCDEDSPVQGGITPHEALQVAEELQRAYEYLKEMGKA